MLNQIEVTEEYNRKYNTYWYNVQTNGHSGN